METLIEAPLASVEPPCKVFSPWELTDDRPRSLSGVKLDGDCLSRFIYVDESGTSANDASVVVAGIIVKGDKHWKAVEDRVAALVKKYIREEHREGFCFSAKNLIGGTGKVFGNRDKYPLNLRLEALKELLAIPSQFGLTLVFGVSTKNPGDDITTKEGRRLAASKNQAKAFGTCVLAAEKYMRRYAGKNELATLVAENNTDTQDMVEWMHEILQGRTPSKAEQGIFKLLSGLTPDVLPIKKIIDTVHFAKKREAPLLQIADACAVTMRFYFEQRRDVSELFNVLTENKPDRLRMGPHGGHTMIEFSRLSCARMYARVLLPVPWGIIKILTKPLWKRWKRSRIRNP